MFNFMRTSKYWSNFPRTLRHKWKPLSFLPKHFFLPNSRRTSLGSWRTNFRNSPAMHAQMEHLSSPRVPVQSVYLAVTQENGQENGKGEQWQVAQGSTHSAGHKHYPSAKLPHHSATGLLKPRGLQITHSFCFIMHTTALQRDCLRNNLQRKYLSRRPVSST